MKKILLVQFRTDQSAQHEQGCIKKHGNLSLRDLLVVNPILKPSTLNNLKLDEFQAVIIGGSGEFEISKPIKIQRSLDESRSFLDKVLRLELPLLGMCFGHQLMAWHLGGKVEADSVQEEVGSFRVFMTEAGKSDPIFAGVPYNFVAQFGHKDSVIKLPERAVHLARTQRNRFAGFKFGKNVYCVQFHPELTLNDLMARLKIYPEYLRGRTLREARKDFLESSEAPKVLKNFLEIVKKSTRDDS